MSQAKAIGIGLVESEEIDRINILRATHKSHAYGDWPLKDQRSAFLADGKPLPDKIYPQTAIIGGDRKCYSIAAASIIAKVYRSPDATVRFRFSGLWFCRHKGYGTKKHILNLS